ncbi:hypothetical protein CHC179_12270 [Helicobacter pylori]
MLKELRQKRPLVHNITNYVVAQFVFKTQIQRRLMDFFVK